jgi:hypothetical protein
MRAIREGTPALVGMQHFLYFLPLPQGQGSLRLGWPRCDTIDGFMTDILRRCCRRGTPRVEVGHETLVTVGELLVVLPPEPPKFGFDEGESVGLQLAPPGGVAAGVGEGVV